MRKVSIHEASDRTLIRTAQKLEANNVTCKALRRVRAEIERRNGAMIAAFGITYADLPARNVISILEGLHS